MTNHDPAPPTTPTEERSSTSWRLGLACYAVVFGIVLGAAADRWAVGRALRDQAARVNAAQLALRQCRDGLGEALRHRQVDWR